jgi:BASS family bile acid:Na+ symporter
VVPFPIITSISRANVALSVTLTVVSMLLAFITLPVLTSAGFDLLPGKSAPVSVLVGQMMAQLFIVLLLPTVAGMWIRRRWTAWVLRKGSLLRRFSMVALAALITFVIHAQAGSLAAQMEVLLWFITLFTLIMMIAGTAIAWGIRLAPADRFTLMVEYAARNLAIVTIVGATLLGHTELVLFAAAFFLIQVPLLLAVVAYRRLKPGYPAVS